MNIIVYYSKTLIRIFENNLKIIDVELIKTHGGEEYFMKK